MGSVVNRATFNESTCYQAVFPYCQWLSYYIELEYKSYCRLRAGHIQYKEQGKVKIWL